MKALAPSGIFAYYVAFAYIIIIERSADPGLYCDEYCAAFIGAMPRNPAFKRPGSFLGYSAAMPVGSLALYLEGASLLAATVLYLRNYLHRPVTVKE